MNVNSIEKEKNSRREMAVVKATQAAERDEFALTIRNAKLRMEEIVIERDNALSKITILEADVAVCCL